MKHLINDYLDYAHYQLGFAESTIQNYKRGLNDRNLYLSQKYATRQVDVSIVTISDVDDYIRVLAGRKGRNGAFSEITINVYLASIRGFIRFCERLRLNLKLAHTDIRMFKKKDRIIDILTDSELEMFLTIPEMVEEGEYAQRNRLLMYMLYYSGMRVSELLSIKTHQITPDLQFTVVGKGSKAREVFIPEFVYQMIVRYNMSRENVTEYLFTSLSNRSRGGKLSRNSIERIIKKYRGYLEIDKKVTPHTFRHTFATNLIRKGARVSYVQKILGHSSIKTTQNYLHLSNRDLHNEYKLIVN